MKKGKMYHNKIRSNTLDDEINITKRINLIFCKSYVTINYEKQDRCRIFWEGCNPFKMNSISIKGATHPETPIKSPLSLSPIHVDRNSYFLSQVLTDRMRQAV